MQMFPGQTPVKIRLQDTGRLVGSRCLLHPALVQELQETAGAENVVVR